MISKKETSSPIIDSMFKAGAHFGFSRSRRHPSVSDFIFGVKNRVEIFDLEKTSVELEKAKEFVKTLASNGKQILFIGGKNEAREAVKRGATEINMPYVAGRWIGGTFTNFPEIKKRLVKMEDMISKREKGEFEKYTKKERLLLGREISNLEIYFGGISSLKDKEMPKAIFVVDPKKEFIAVDEAKTVKIPVIALSNTDCDIKDIEYPIPANDASVSSIEFIVSEIVKAYKEGKAVLKKS